MKYTQSTLGVTVAEAQSIASVLSGQLKVTIKEGEEWKYRPEHKAVYYRREDLKILTQEDVIANLLHETGHAKYTQDEMMWTYGNIPHPHKLGVKMAIDLLEDFRMEDKLRAEYPYAVDYLPTYSFKTKWYFQKITEKYEEKARLSGQAEEVPKILQYLNQIYSYISGEAVLVLGETKPEVKEALSKTQEKMDDIRKTSTSTLEIVKRIREEIYPDIKKLFEDSKEPEQQPQSGQLDDKKEGEKPEPKKEGDGKGKPEEKEGDKPQPAKPKPADGFETEDEQEIVKLFKQEYKEGRKEKHEPYDDMYPFIKPLINKTADKLRKILTDKAFDKFEGKFTSGKKLNQRRMYKPRLGDYRVFQRITEATKNDYEFALVVDLSGSMRYPSQKIKEALKASMLFAHVLNKLEIPYIMYGFNEYMFEFKTSDQRYDIQLGKKIASQMWNEVWHLSPSKNGAGYNDDAEAIYNVAKMLKSSKSKKKIMMVFSDGQPAPSHEHGFKHLDVKLEVKKATKDGIDVVGIGLEYGDLEDYYKHCVIVNDISKLPDETVKVVKAMLKK